MGKLEIERKNPTINIDLDGIQQVPNQTSKYIGVCWHRDNKKWQAYLKHNNKLYSGGYFDNEAQAAMQVNLLCDKHGKERKNPTVDEKIKIKSQKRKRQQDSMIVNGDVKEEKVETKIPNYDENQLLE